MGEAKTAGEMERRGGTDELDPGAYIGQEPEREAESIPGGIKPGDERIAAYAAAPGVPGEPGTDPGKAGSDRQGEAGQDR